MFNPLHPNISEILISGKWIIEGVGKREDIHFSLKFGVKLELGGSCTKSGCFWFAMNSSSTWNPAKSQDLISMIMMTAKKQKVNTIK